MSFLGLMTVRAHEVVVAELRRQIEVAKANKTAMAESMTSENRRLGREVAGLRADVRTAEMAYEEARKGQQRVAAELAALRPDAQKWRDRKQADREYRAEKRAQVNV